MPRVINQPYKVRIGVKGETQENWMLGNVGRQKLKNAARGQIQLLDLSTFNPKVAIEDPTNGNVYKFEFEERLVKDDYLDGWIEAALSEFEGSGSSEECMKARIPRE